jgi:hypothetical protein
VASAVTPHEPKTFLKEFYMKRILSFGIAVAVCACALVAGCAKAPQNETIAANAAIAAAKTAKAPLFAAEQFKSAQELITSAEAELKAQNAKSPFSRNYDKAKKMLIEGTAAADAAKSAVEANKAKISEEAKALFDKAKAAIDESKKMVEELIKKKNKEAAALKTKLDAAASSLPADLSKVTEDALIVTRDAIKEALASAESVKASIAQLAPAKKAPAAKGKKGKKK